MKIAIYCSTVVPFHAFSLKERPLGGIETGAIRLAEALTTLGHEVTVYTPHENPPNSNPRYLPKHKIQEVGELDVLISLRDWIPLLYNVPAKLRLFWTGDSYDQYPNFGIGDMRVHSQIDGFLAVSKWHADTLCQASGFPRDKAFVIGNGIELSLFESEVKKERKKMIYSSMPYRGLAHIPDLFSQVKAKHPDAEIHIYSGYQVYDQNQKEDFEKMVESLKAAGCSYHGNILQKDLAIEYLKSSILFYPCHFEETSCITAMEAQAAGCVVVSSRLAALPETVGDAGFLIEGLPDSPKYRQEFVSAVDRLLSDDTLFEKLSKTGRNRSKSFTWLNAAEKLQMFLKQHTLK